MNFREVNKKLNELKQSGNKQALEQFRNTKISEINFFYLIKAWHILLKALICVHRQAISLNF